MEKWLEVQNISFERNERTLFHDLSFTLDAADVLQIHGENGCGKSTLLRILAGFIEVETGKILWRSSSRHYVGHQHGMKLQLTVSENLGLHRALGSYHFDISDLKQVLYRVGLQKHFDTPTAQLSQGQLRRLCLARLLLSQAQTWILDEPLTALDPEGQQLIKELIQEHSGVTIVATHHDLGFGKKLSLFSHHPSSQLHDYINISTADNSICHSRVGGNPSQYSYTNSEIPLNLYMDSRLRGNDRK